MNIDNKLFRQMQQCNNLLRRGMFMKIVKDGPVVPDFGFGRSQARLLKVLAHKDAVPMKDLAEILDVRPSSVGELVTKLEKQGLVERKENENDKRTVLVCLTEAGRTKAKQAQECFGEAGAKMFGALTDEEKQQLSATLEKLIEAAKDEQPEGECMHGGRRRGFGGRGFGFGRRPMPMHCHCGNDDDEEE